MVDASHLTDRLRIAEMAPAENTNCRVAICDDVDDFRRVMQIMLEGEPGIEVVGQAKHGGEAIELVKTVQVDVL
jgi:CheY-like chemotaxis protein